jgi:hypothetical protein
VGRFAYLAETVVDELRRFDKIAWSHFGQP